MALRGAGVEPDHDAVRALFRSAAHAGDAEAMIELATMSQAEEARRWLLRACGAGHPPAMLHYCDLMLQRDPVDALAWLYAGAAITADDDARKRAEALARELTAKEIDAAQKAGRAHLKQIQAQARGR